MDRPHWNEILDALQEDADFCEDGVTTIARDGAIAILGAFHNADDGRETVEENEVPQILLQARPAFRQPWVPGRPRGSQRCAEVQRFLRSQTKCKWQRSGTAHEALEHSTVEIAHNVCKMSQTWTLGSRVSRRESRTTQRRKVRSTCNETWGKLKMVHHCSKAHGTKTFLSRFVTLDPGEVLWDNGAQEGLVWKQQLDKWCKLLAEHGLQVEWSQEKPESTSGIGGVTQPIGVVYVPVGLAGCNGVIRITVVEQDVPPPLRVEIMRTLQACLDLNDDSDKEIFRQFGGESSLRTLQSGHTVIRADQFDPDGWQLPEITELCQNNDEGRATNYMSVIAHAYQRPRCMDDDTPAGDHDPASTRSCRTRQKTTSKGDGPTRSHPTNLPTTLPRFASGKQMHGTFENHERDVQTSSRLRPPTDCYPEERQHCDARRTMRKVWESVAAHSPVHGGTESRDEAEQSHIACVPREAVEIECPFCPHGHGSTMIQATPQQSLYWECSTSNTT